MLLSSGGQTVVATASAGPVLGPSGLPAIERTYPAGTNPGEHDSPYLPAPDAVIADRDSVGDQLAYAKQAAALPASQPGLKWNNPGPIGQVDPPGYPTGSIRFARDAGMGVTVATDPRDVSGNTVHIGNMGGLWKSTNGGASYTHLGDNFARPAVGARLAEGAG